VICLASGLHGYFFRENRLWEGLFLLAAAVLLIKPGYVTDAIGLALLAMVVINQKFLRPSRTVASRAK
jgi:UPF0716 family protein affecting phage T7 exclusion